MLVIEKTPIVHHDENVGIGFANPLAKLAIDGGLHVGGESETDSPGAPPALGQPPGALEANTIL